MRILKHMMAIAIITTTVFALSACTSANTQDNTTSASVEDRISQAEEISTMMGKDTMDDISVLFPDIEKTKDITGENPLNIMGMGDEAWFYSKEADITVAVCLATNAPLHVFEGDNPTAEKVKSAKEMIIEMIEGGSMMEGDMSYLEDAPEYTDFTQALHSELKGKKPFAIFFHATWCPTCKALENEIKPVISTFPKGTKILKADFDTEKALKKEYGITIQSTIAIIDAKGNHVKTLAAPGVSELMSEIKKSL